MSPLRPRLARPGRARPRKDAVRACRHSLLSDVSFHSVLIVSVSDSSSPARVSRRDFLATTSLTAASAILGARTLRASPVRLAPGAARSAANALLPAPMAAADLQQFAAAALEAAHSAGAAFADVRVAEWQQVEVAQRMFAPLTPSIDLDATFTYGVRAQVDGQWAFAYGSAPTVDALAASARHAVATARSSARVMHAIGDVPAPEWAPTPVQTGTWASPRRIDPFAVPIEDQLALLWALQSANGRVPGGSGPDAAAGLDAFVWTRETRVFASTEGALLTQTLHRGTPYFYVQGERGLGSVGLTLPSLVPASGGYELVLAPGLQERIKAYAEEVVRLARVPVGPMDVGRYPVVCDGVTLGSLLAMTVGTALELDRVMGEEAGGAGTSYLSPPATSLGTQITAPLLHVTAGRSLPALNAVQWDDDGVETHDYPVITAGTHVDYHTSRQTAPALADWYRQRGQPLRSHGCALAPSADNPVLIRTPHLTVAPGPETASLETLARELSRGLLIRQATMDNVHSDASCATGMLVPPLLFEIDHGKVVRRITDAALQFRTSALWQSLTHLGDASTIDHSVGQSNKGEPWTLAMLSATAPAGLFPTVDLIALR